MSTELAHRAYWTAVPCPPTVACAMTLADELGGVGLVAAESREREGSVRGDAGVGRLLEGVHLRYQQRGLAKSPPKTRR